MPNRVDRPLNIAHRGASRMAPENTLSAFEQALEIGADGIEFDVRLSADGVPVVIHDASVNATTTGYGRVDKKTLAELKRLDAGSSFGPAFAGERIPTLAEVLETMERNVLLNVELKGNRWLNGELDETVLAVVEEYGMEENVLISSFNPLALRRVQQITPCVPTALLYAYPSWLALRLASLALPRPVAALHPHHALVNEQLIRWARANQIRLHVWTVDDPTDMRRLITWGVEGLITNRPDLLKEALEAVV